MAKAAEEKEQILQDSGEDIDCGSKLGDEKLS